MESRAMTDDEQDKIVAEWFRDLSKAKIRRDCLDTKAKNYLKAISMGRDFMASFVDDEDNGVHIKRPPPPPEGSWPSHLELMEVTAEIQETRSRIADLRGKLGV